MNASSTRAFAAFISEPEAPLHVPTLERYWRDPEFAREQDAERAEWQRQTNRLIDEGVRKARARLSEKDQPNA